MPGADPRPLLVCFDDSDASRHALAEAARLFPAARAVVLHVWRSLESTVAYRYSAAGATGAMKDTMAELDAAGQQAAQAVAEEGAKLARELGLDAEPLAIMAEDHSDEVVAEHAEACDALVVVMGSRRLGPIQSLALGGFSTPALHRSVRPVLIVPAAASSVR
jgi:nucleotide-binding universal stress UspA family protein